MKKVLSVLLAVCLFATLLVPAFAENYGKYADVAKVEFDKTEYKLEDITKDRTGGLYVDVTNLLTCWDANGNRTNYADSGLTESEIRAYWVSNNEVLSIDDNGRIISIKPKLDRETRVTLRVTLASGKQATTTIVVPSNKSTGSKDAYGYRLKDVEVQEGTRIGAVSEGDATLTYEAPATPKASVLTIDGATYTAGTNVALAAGNTATKNAKAIADGITSIVLKTIVYTPVAYQDGDTAVVFEASNYTGALPSEYVPAPAELKIVTTNIAGVAGSVAETTAAELITELSGAIAMTQAGDYVEIDGVQYVWNTDLATTLGAAVTGYNAADKKFTVAIDSTNKLKFTANDNAAITAADVPVVKAVIGGAAVATIALTPGDDTKGVYTYTTAAAQGVTKLSIFGKNVALNGGEAADLVADKIIASSPYTSPNGFTYVATAGGAANEVVFTAQENGTDTTGIIAAITDISKMVDASSVNTSLSFGDGAGAAGNPFVYNVGDEITPVLSSYSFTGDQKKAFRFAIRTTKAGANSHQFELIEDQVKDIYGLEFLMCKDADGNMQLLIGEGANFETYKGTYVYVRVLNDKFSNAQSEKEFSVKLVGAAGEKDSILPAEAHVGVGKVLDLTTLNSSVDGVKKYWAVLPYGNYQTPKEAGLIAKTIIETVDDNGAPYGWTVKGLAPGVVTIALFNGENKLVDTMKLNVGAGSPATPTPSTANATVKVNEQVKLSVKNLNSDEYVKWSIDNSNVSLANFDGAAATVYGKKEGTAVVTAKVYESKAAANDGKDPVNTFKINVTVKAAESKPVTTPTTTAPTANPQTGDSLFANLF